MNIASATSVGPSAPANSQMGLTASSKERASRVWPAGFGALAITVQPPPVTAPLTTAN